MRIWLFIAALCGALGVLVGAFAAHGLSGRLDARAMGLFETGARYQMYHALAMGLAALAMRGAAVPRARLAAIAFLVGIVLFSGSLYLLALTGATALALLTPLGGLAFLGGWGFLAAAALKLPVSID
jgi:uncharacterized membrane protein YgdD (TMEM256/DUF423 family)